MKRLSIRWVLTLTMVGVALAAMLVVTGVYSAQATTLFNQMGMSSMLQDMQLVSERIGDVCRRVTGVLQETAVYLEGGESLTVDGISARAYSTMGGAEDVCALLLVDEYGRPVAGCPTEQLKADYSLMGMDWFGEASQAQVGVTVFSRPHVQSLYEGSYPWVVSVTRKVRYTMDGEPHVGVLMADMKLTPLHEICQSVTLGSSGSPFILTQQDEIIYHPDQRLLALELIPQESLLMEGDETLGRRMVLSQEIEGTDWRVVGTVLASDIEENSRAFRQRMVGVVCVVALQVLLVAVWLSLQLVRPLYEIQASMQRIERNLDDTRMSLPEEGFSEYAALSHSYNAMLHKIRRLMSETVDRQEQLRRMELGALQEQINPHFLYNTLDSIVRVMEQGRTPQAIEMVQALAKLFRLSINNGDYYLTVEQEMDYARSYLTIQQIRYRKSFSYELHMDERIKNLLCPKLMLQPLVENAVKHGMSDMPGCTLVIRARQEGYNIVFTIEDDGLGIPPERLRQLQDMLRSDGSALEDKSGFGIGLRNTNRRIKLLYGAQYGLTIESEVEERTCITITLPKRQR